MKKQIITLSLIIGILLVGFLFLNNQLAARTIDQTSLNQTETSNGGTVTGRSAIPTLFTGGSGGCCGFDQNAAAADPLATSALEYYRQNYEQRDDLSAEVEDYGCHQEISIRSAGQEIHRFSHVGGNFYDLTVQPN